MNIAEFVALLGIGGGVFQGFWLVLSEISKAIKQQYEVEKRLGFLHFAIMDKLEDQDKKISNLEAEISAYRISTTNADWLGLPEELTEGNFLGEEEEDAEE